MYDFEAFMKEVDRELVRICGMKSNDLPDYLYRDAHEDGMSAHDVAVDALAQACTCFGLELWDVS